MSSSPTSSIDPVPRIAVPNASSYMSKIFDSISFLRIVCFPALVFRYAFCDDEYA
jgi:hypothetical protein